MCLQLVTKFPAVYGNWSSVSCLQRFIICTTMGKMNPVHTFPVSFLKIHCNILPCTPRSSTWSLLFTFPPQIPCMHFSFSICATCSTHLILIYLITWIISGEGYKSHSFYSLCNILQATVIPYLLCPNTFLSTAFSNTQHLCYSLNLRENFSVHCPEVGNYYWCMALHFQWWLRKSFTY